MELRPLYHRLFNVPGRLKVQNEANGKAMLAEARIYERPTAP